MQVEADGLVVCLQGQVVELSEDASADPLVAPSAHRGRRAGTVSVLLIGAAQDEAGQEFVEDDPVRDARPVTSQRVVDAPFGKQRLELLPQRVGDEGGQDGHAVF